MSAKTSQAKETYEGNGRAKLVKETCKGKFARFYGA
jgi:hypothetical protein